jgi:hypothetical protein
VFLVETNILTNETDFLIQSAKGRTGIKSPAREKLSGRTLA